MREAEADGCRRKASRFVMSICTPMTLNNNSRQRMNGYCLGVLLSFCKFQTIFCLFQLHLIHITQRNWYKCVSFYA